MGVDALAAISLIRFPEQSEAEKRYWRVLNRAKSMGAQVTALDFSALDFLNPPSSYSVVFELRYSKDKWACYTYRRGEDFDHVASEIERLCDEHREAYWSKEAERWSAV